MGVLNVFKCPAPALEVNTKGEWVFSSDVYAQLGLPHSAECSVEETV